VLANLGFGLIGVAHGHDFIATALQKLGHELSHIGIVVDHQNAWNAPVD
jgi:hypothetical protein